jgi:hypothetical protein
MAKNQNRRPRAPVFKMEMGMPTVQYEIGDSIPDGQGGYDVADEKEIVGKWHTNRLRFELSSTRSNAGGQKMHDCTLVIRYVDQKYRVEVEQEEDGKRVTKTVDRPSEYVHPDERELFLKNLQSFGADREVLAMLRNNFWHGRDGKEVPMPIGETVAVDAIRAPYQLPSAARRTRTLRVPYWAILEAHAKPGDLIRVGGRSPIHVQGVDLVTVQARTKDGDAISVKMPRRILIVERAKFARKENEIVGIDKPGIVLLLEHEDPKVKLGLRLKQVRDWIEFQTAPFLARVADTGIKPKAEEAEEPKPSVEPSSESPKVETRPDAVSGSEPIPAADGAPVSSN